MREKHRSGNSPARYRKIMARKTIGLLLLFASAILAGRGAGALPDHPLGSGEATVHRGEATAGARELFDARRVMDLVYMSRPDSALALIEARRAEDPEDPFVLLLKTKVLRERLNDEDNNKELVRRSAESIHALLDSAIALSNEALRRDAADVRQYYYRGYCWLNKAQLHVLARSYWAAGRTAARGKDDLERYLKTHPDDPDAQGVLGAFLYFADAIPRYVRFVAKLLFIPTGDREKGLAMMRYAATHDGLFSTDWRFVLAAIDMVFDGNFERGTEEFIRLLDEFPFYTRLAEPLAVVAPLYPARTAELRRIAERALDAHLTLDPEHVDWSLVKRMRLLNAFTDSYFGRPREALEEYAALAADPPRHPDWVPAIALLNRGYLLQKLGGRDEARRSFETVRANPRSAYYRRVCETMVATVDLPLKTWEADDLGFVAAIYEGAHTDAAARLRFYAVKYGEDAAYDFYAGDLAALSGDAAAARTAYERALSRAEAGGDQIYQLFAAARLAEIVGSDGRYDKAREYLKRARGYCYANYLLRFLLESRERFYDLREKGRMEGEPALFTPHPPRR